MRCPGQDTQYWKPGDIFDVDCPRCGRQVEFFKDEATRRCRACGGKVMNPRMDLGCSGYCRHAAGCGGSRVPLPERQRKRENEGKKKDHRD